MAEKKKKKQQPKADSKQKTTEEKFEKLVSVDIAEEMKTSYLSYAMSVIVGRAIPDIRDGLKPVHRRILFSMNEQGMVFGKPFKKSARVVGDVLGKYHPHGDIAIYDSLVRMAQDFSLRYPLVDGQGNFGSVDGDGAAAMRYTETRMAKLANELLEDLDKETVNFSPNFDESLEEPTVMPAKIPNLLINGSSGIAVGMATNIPPHNLSEVCQGAIEMIDDPEIKGEALIKVIKGPDFPTGANICGDQGIREAYLTGKGSVSIRAQLSIEPAPHKNDRECIVVTEIPYQVNKANLIIKIADLVRDKKITGIADLRDESGKQGMRIYIELKKGTVPKLVLNQLYKHTQLQNSFGINLLAIVGGEPKLCTLREMLKYFLMHREEVIRKRTEYELKKAEERAHILEGLLIALKNLDAVITLIKKSKDPGEAREKLAKRFKLSKNQAQAILDMKLQRLTALETQKIEEEHKEIKTRITDYKDILAKLSRRMQIIKQELQEMIDKYGDERRTRLLGEAQDVEVEDLIPKEEVAVFITRQGFVKRMQVSSFRSQMRGGRGVAGMDTREEDEIENIFITSTHSYMVVFTDKGICYRVKVFEIPDASRASKGQSITNFIQLGEGEKITALLEVSDFTQKDIFMLMATKNGVVKKTAITDFENIRRTGVIAIKLDGGDSLNWVRKTDSNKDVMLTTKTGLLIRFSEKEVREMGRATRGVRGIKLKNRDEVVSMDVLGSEDDKKHTLIVSKNGSGKRTEVSEYRCQGRGGKGVRCLSLRDGDEAAKMVIVEPKDQIMVVTVEGIVSRQKVKDVSVQGRAAKGVRVQKLGKEDEVVDVAVIHRHEEEAPLADKEIPQTQQTKKKK